MKLKQFLHKTKKFFTLSFFYFISLFLCFYSYTIKLFFKTTKDSIWIWTILNLIIFYNIRYTPFWKGIFVPLFVFNTVIEIFIILKTLYIDKQIPPIIENFIGGFEEIFLEK